MAVFQIICIRHDDTEWFLAWSDDLNAPVSFGLTEIEMLTFLEGHEGEQDAEAFDARIAAAREQVSDPRLSRNEAGYGGERLTQSQIIEAYCNGPTR